MVKEALAEYGHKVQTLEGDQTQFRRRRAIEGFRDGAIRILVATDIAARGLDISRVSHVINFDMPVDTETYIHRIGRTGRAQRTGKAYTFVTERDQEMARQLVRLLGGMPEQRRYEGF